MANAGQVRRYTMSPAITPALNPFFGLLPPKLWKAPKDFFMYSANFLPLAAGATQTTDIAIESDSDFLIVAGVRTITDGATDLVFQAAGPFTVVVFDNGSGRNLQNQAQHIENMFGTAELPAYWPFPKFVPRASTLSTTLQNLDATNAFNIRIAYFGFKIFAHMG